MGFLHISLSYLFCAGLLVFLSGVAYLVTRTHRHSLELKQKIDYLDRQEILQREITSQLSHDFRGPLTAIQGYVETLIEKNNTLSSKERTEYLEIALHNTHLLNTLVTDLLDATKLEAKIITPRLAPFSLPTLISQLSKKLAFKVAHKQLVLHLECSATLPQVVGDISMIERALSNILLNAIRYTPLGGEILLSCIEKKDVVFISICDNGIGIPPQDLPHVFERFYRVDKDRSRTTGGVGLGLAITKGILDAHGSSVSITSTVGKGTEITFSLAKVPKEYFQDPVTLGNFPL